MRKLVPIFILLLLSCTLHAAVKISITNGAWSSPGTWSPGGAPGPADDIYIYHQVTFNQNITWTGVVFHVDTFAQLIDVGTDSMFLGGDDFLNLGYITAAFVALGAGDSAVNRGDMNIGEFAQSGEIYNFQFAAICVAQQMVTSDLFVNNGSVSASSWISTGTVTGNTGRFCIGNNFMNSGQISGTIDICDASPGQPGDINTGTTAGTVTNCQSIPCDQCMPIGFAEYNQQAGVTIIPHPVTGTAQFVFESVQLNSFSRNNLVVTDVTGRVVQSILFSGTTVFFDRTGLESGLYFYRLHTGTGLISQGKLLIE